jgi:hypothetical protein
MEVKLLIETNLGTRIGKPFLVPTKAIYTEDKKR